MREDHVYPLPDLNPLTGVPEPGSITPVETCVSNHQGYSLKYAREDHSHKLNYIAFLSMMRQCIAYEEQIHNTLSQAMHDGSNPVNTAIKQLAFEKMKQDLKYNTEISESLEHWFRTSILTPSINNYT